MKTYPSSSQPWRRLPNGNLVHRSGIELVNDGQRWRMTEQSGWEFVRFAIREQGLSCREAAGLGDLIVEQGASWASHGLH
jgi:hypothetical protein